MIDVSKYTQITTDSREVIPGALFVALPGLQCDGHDYIDQAISKGATGLVVSKKLSKIVGVDVYESTDLVGCLHQLCQDYYKDPFSLLKTIAVTGTNGKTTVTYLIEAIFKEAKLCSGVIGTIDYRVGDQVLQKASHTTPPAPLIYSVARRMVDIGAEAVVIEASSQALEQRRLAGVPVDVAVFTNLSRDHLDYHGSMQKYFASKRVLFESLNETGFAVINKDDSYYDEICLATQAKSVSYGFSADADIACVEMKNLSCQLRLPDGQLWECPLPLFGEHNVLNIMAAIAVAWTQGIDMNVIKMALQKFDGVPGRMQSWTSPLGAVVYV